MMKDIAAFHSPEIGSEEFGMPGSRLVENMVSNLLFTGTVVAPGPIYRRNALKNFVPFSVYGYRVTKGCIPIYL